MKGLPVFSNVAFCYGKFKAGLRLYIRAPNDGGSGKIGPFPGFDA
jgi:hypothetical protein